MLEVATIDGLMAAIAETCPSEDGPRRAMDDQGNVYKFLTSNGVKEEGQAAENRQLFFTPEEAIRAFWYYFCQLYGNDSFEYARNIDAIVWRERPHLDEHDGTYRVSARLSFKTCPQRTVGVSVRVPA